MNKDLIPFDDAARAKAPYSMIKLEDGYTHYRRMGPRDGQTLILIHGLSTPMFTWNGMIKGFADAGMNVIAYDIYGRGWSDRPDLDNDSVLFNRQLEQLIAALEIKGKVDLVGVSMGGLISGYYAEKNPEKVRKIGMIAPSGYVAEFPFMIQMMRTPGIGGWLMDVFGGQSFVKSMKAYQFENSPLPDLVERYKELLTYEGFTSSVSSTLTRLDLDRATASYKTVGKNNIPVQIIWGSADKVAPYRNAALFKRDIPQSKLYTVPEGSHALPLSHADEITAVLVKFLQIQE